MHLKLKKKKARHCKLAILLQAHTRSQDSGFWSHLNLCSAQNVGKIWSSINSNLKFFTSYSKISNILMESPQYFFCSLYILLTSYTSVSKEFWKRIYILNSYIIIIIKVCYDGVGCIFLDSLVKETKEKREKGLVEIQRGRDYNLV